MTTVSPSETSFHLLLNDTTTNAPFTTSTDIPFISTTIVSTLATTANSVTLGELNSSSLINNNSSLINNNSSLINTITSLANISTTTISTLISNSTDPIVQILLNSSASTSSHPTINPLHQNLKVNGTLMDESSTNHRLNDNINHMNKSIVKVLKDLTSNVTNGTIGAIGKVDEISTQPPDVTTAPYNIFVSYPYLFYAFLLLLILIIITVFTAIVTFLIRNRKRIIRQESNDALHKFQSPVRYTLFSCCPCFEKEKKHYEEPLERQNSASNLGPYRRPPLPPVRRADENEDGYKGSYIPRANQLKPIQLDAAVYGTLEKSAPSTLTKNTFSTTLDSNSPSSYRHPHYSRSTLN